MAKGGSRPQALCHPDRPHESLGLCRACYATRARRAKGIKPIDKMSAEQLYGNKLDRVYGVGAGEHYLKQLKTQAGKCALCGRIPKRRLDFDHCHVTGKFRELLCHSCNKLLGALQDDVVLARSVVGYLERHTASEREQHVRTYTARA
jgi:hypothetical protein